MPIFRIEWSECHALELPFADEEAARSWWRNANLHSEVEEHSDLDEGYFGLEITEVEG